MTDETSIHPQVPILYACGSKDHDTKVLKLATRLRYDGVDARLDQWNLLPGDDVNRFMEQEVSEADVFGVICSKPYVEKADKREGGVGYETSLLLEKVRATISQNRKRIIPILWDNPNKIRPAWLESKAYIDFDKGDSETNYKKLLYAIHDKPTHPIPPIGINRFTEKEAYEKRWLEPLAETIRNVSAWNLGQA